MRSSQWRGRMGRVFGVVAAVFAVLVALGPIGTAQASQFLSKTYSGRTYKLFIPSSYQSGSPMPLVVMLHGCTQDPDQFAAGTEMNTVAEAQGFLVAYPDQPSSAGANKCWNWFLSAHQSRGSGEPALIAGLVGQIKADYAVNGQKVYVAGLSAGAAMSVIMGATYPDVFAAIGVGSGLEYKAATTQTAAYTAMSSGGPDPVAQGNLAYSAMGSYARVVPTIVFHGTSDYTVQVVNGNQIISQWAQTNDRASDGSDNNNIDDTADQTISGSVSGGRTYTRYLYRDSANGTTVMEKYLVDGMGHAWSGGSTAGSYTDPNGPKASQLMWEFFAARTLSGSAPTATPAPTSAATATPAPTGAPTATPAPTSAPTATPGSGTQLVAGSVGGEDGYAGALTADGFSTTTSKIGDKGMYNTDTYRTILSFDTSALPDNATITGATLTFTRSALSGTVGTITVDIRSGGFGGSTTLAQTDYNAAASASAVATVAAPSANGASSSVALSSGALASINKTGTTQLRLRASTAADFTSDVLTIVGGEGGSGAPTLTITYN